MGERGFTLMEALAALFILSVGAAAAFALATQITSFIGNTKDKATASYLAQEGIEIVRNIRDSNFLEIHKTGSGSWTQGIDPGTCATGCGADYNDGALSGALAGSSLLFDGSFYNYDSGISTTFQRSITVTNPSTDKLAVEVEVTWQEKGITRSVTAETEFYNWLQPTP